MITTPESLFLMLTSQAREVLRSVETAIIDEVVSLCRAGDDEKASVKAKIKGFQCSWAKPRKLDLTNKGIIKWTGNLEESNLGDWAKAWLMKKL